MATCFIDSGSGTISDMPRSGRKSVSGRCAGGRGWLLVHLLTVLSLSAYLASCTPLRIQFPVTASEPDWASDGRDGSRGRAATDEPVRLPIEQYWIYNASAGFGTGSPLVVSDHVFVGTRKGELHVIELMTGDRVGTQEFGQSIEGAPALADNVIYVPNSWGKNAVTAFDLREGTKLWEYRGVPVEASILVVDDLIVFGDVEAKIVAIGRTTGLVEWVYTFEDVATIFAGPTEVGDGRIVAATEAGEIACIDLADGSQEWHSRIDGAVESSIASDERRVYIPTTRGTLHAFDARTGRLEWMYRAPDRMTRLTGAAVSGESVVFGGSDGLLRAVDVESGSTLWTFETDGTFAAPPAISGSLVFAGAMDREFFAIGLADGTMQWSTTLRGRVKSAPAIRKGLVVVLSEPKYVLRIWES